MRLGLLIVGCETIRSKCSPSSCCGRKRATGVGVLLLTYAIDQVQIILIALSSTLLATASLLIMIVFASANPTGLI